MIDREKAHAILDAAHAAEQQSGKLIGRKDFQKFLPEDMPYADRRKLIKTWQASYFQRLSHIGVFRRQMRNDITVR